MQDYWPFLIAGIVCIFLSDRIDRAVSRYPRLKTVFRIFLGALALTILFLILRPLLTLAGE